MRKMIHLSQRRKVIWTQSISFLIIVHRWTFSGDIVQWLPRDHRVGQAIVFYNIAVIYAITKDVEKAFKYFNSVDRR